MFTEIVTTITSKIDLDTLTPTHSVSIDAEYDLGKQVIYAIVVGACKSTVKSLETNDEVDDEESA